MLEAYNRTFGDKFPHPNPSLLDFGTIVDKETDEWVEKTDYAQQDVYKNARNRKEIEWPKVPDDFDDWKPTKKKCQKNKQKKDK